MLIGLTAYTYVIGRVVGVRRSTRADAPAGARDKIILAMGIIPVVGSLVVFKFLGSLSELGNGLFEVLPISVSLPVLQLALPIDISFWTFCESPNLG